MMINFRLTLGKIFKIFRREILNSLYISHWMSKWSEDIPKDNGKICPFGSVCVLLSALVKHIEMWMNQMLFRLQIKWGYVKEQ